MFDFFHAVTTKVGAIFLSVALFFGATAPGTTVPLESQNTSDAASTSVQPQMSLEATPKKEVAPTVKPSTNATQMMTPESIQPTPVQVVTQPTQTLPPNNSQMCKDAYGQYATWSATLSSCTCVEGFDVSADGKTCVKVQAVQQAPQPDLSINQAACDTAVDNLVKMQKMYGGAMAGTGGTTAVVEGTSAIYTKQYNTKLPAYQLLAEAACKIPASHPGCQESIQKFNALFSIKNVSVTDYSYLQYPAYQTEIYYACQ